MTDFPIFASVVFVVRNQAAQLEAMLTDASNFLSNLVSDHELIIVENASDDGSVALLKEMTEENGLPNLQVYARTKEVDAETAAWVGAENALGDFVAILNPLTDDIHVLPQMLEKAVTGCDVVFATNDRKPKQTLGYRLANAAFNLLYRLFNGINLTKEAPQYRVLSKRVINFILQHSLPAVSYRHLPATSGFVRGHINYSYRPQGSQAKHLGDSIERGLQLIVSSTGGPMRLVSFLSLFGAGANLVYSLYVVAVALFMEGVAAGWVSMSLQMSGMFFLISLVLLVLGEYILHMASLNNEGPRYHVGQEFTSARITRKQKLNIEEVASIAE